MTGKDILDRAEKILARTDVDRVELLFYMNQAIKDPLRDRSIYRMQGTKAYTLTGGIAATPTLKNTQLVRWTNEESSADLKKLMSLDDAYGLYTDPTETGIPQYYVIVGETIQTVPAGEGTLLVAGEFWPDDLTDGTTTNLYSIECPMALVYYGVAEYFDFFQEEKRAQLYRSKGASSLAQWVKENRRQEMSAVTMDGRDPLGTLGTNRRRQGVSQNETEYFNETVIIDYVGE